MKNEFVFMANSDSLWMFHWIALQWNSILGFGFGYTYEPFKSFTSETLCTSRGSQSLRNEGKQGAGNRMLVPFVSYVWLRVTSHIGTRRVRAILRAYASKIEHPKDAK